MSHFWEIYGQCTKFSRVIEISQFLVFHFTTTFSGCLQIKPENTQREDMCDIVFEKVQGCAGKVNRTSVYAEAAVRKVL